VKCSEFDYITDYLHGTHLLFHISITPKDGKIIYSGFLGHTFDHSNGGILNLGTNSKQSVK